MTSKLTLITPPDIFENNNTSILFIHLSEKDQDITSKWLSDVGLQSDLNLYVYTGEPNASWLLYAASRCEYKYIDLDETNLITQLLGGYILSKTGVYYKTKDENLAQVCKHINQNRVDSIEKFLEVTLNDQER